MLRTLRNLIVNVMAAFIRDRDKRHKFRNKYKIRSKFRKLRDDNRRLFIENKRLFKENKVIKQEITNIKNNELKIIKQELLKINSSLFSVSNVSADSPRVYLSIACMALNEAPYLKEWIEYHKLIGVERIYFYDNGSDDNTTQVLRPYIQDGLVLYKRADGYGIHMSVFNDAVCKYRHQTFWMALMDLDEFLVPVEKDNMQEALKEFEQYPAIGINWVCFDTNGHKTKPVNHGGLVTANYTRVSKEYDVKVNRHIKSIVNPREVLYVNSSHFATYRRGSSVTENFEPVMGAFTKYHSSSKIRINHYFTKSEEEYIERHNKQKKTSNRNRMTQVKKLWLVEQDFEETTEDTVILKYLPDLKKAMGIED